MEGEKLVPASYINAKLSELVVDNISVGLSFKRELKNSIVMFT